MRCAWLRLAPLCLAGSAGSQGRARACARLVPQRAWRLRLRLRLLQGAPLAMPMRHAQRGAPHYRRLAPRASRLCRMLHPHPLLLTPCLIPSPRPAPLRRFGGNTSQPRQCQRTLPRPASHLPRASDVTHGAGQPGRLGPFQGASAPAASAALWPLPAEEEGGGRAPRNRLCAHATIFHASIVSPS